MKAWRNIHHGGKRRDGAAAADKRKEDMIDFSVNVTPLGIPGNIRRAMEESLSRAEWYPDDSKRNLKEALNIKYGLPVENICVGNGASDLIFRTVFALRPKRALVLAPTFAEYEAALRCVDAQIEYYEINHEDFQVKADICGQIYPETDMVFLCNPNNPTGLLMSKDSLMTVLKRCEATDTWMVVDECFLEFVRQGERYSLIGELAAHPKLLIIKSFTKMFGIAGLRLGYLLCGEEGLGDGIDKFGCDWNVNCVAEAAGLEALRSADYESKVLAYVETERKWLYEELMRLGLKVVSGQTNYLFERRAAPKNRWETGCSGRES
ncbi:MAG: pyridoxal phosphate-dependent aminotransferase [Frisingicoccus sp.]